MKKPKFDKKHPFVNGMAGPGTCVDKVNSDYLQAAAAKAAASGNVMSVTDVEMYQKFCQQLAQDLTSVRTAGSSSTSGSTDSSTSTDSSSGQLVDEVQKLIDGIRGIDFTKYPDGTPVDIDAKNK